MRREDRIELDNGDRQAFLDRLTDLFLIGVATADQANHMDENAKAKPRA